MTLDIKLTKLLDRRHQELINTSWLVAGIPLSFTQGLDFNNRTASTGGMYHQFNWVKDTVVENRFYSHFMDTTPMFAVYDVESGDGFTVMLSSVNFTETWASQVIVHHPYGPSGIAVTGTASSLTTNLTLANDLTNYKVRIVSGTNAGEERTITSAIYGNIDSLSGTIYVDPPFTNPIDNTTVYQLLTGKIQVYFANSNVDFSSPYYYDWATDTVVKVVYGNQNAGYTYYWGGKFLTSGTSTSGTSNTITVSGKNWKTNQFKYQQVRLVSGIGAGQVRDIDSNTNDTITISGTWSVTPSSNTGYILETSESFVYDFPYGRSSLYRRNVFTNVTTLIGNNLTTRYSQYFSFNPAEVDHPFWKNEDDLLNGRYIYYYPSNTDPSLYRYSLHEGTNQLVFTRKNSQVPAGRFDINYDKNHLYINLLNSSTFGLRGISRYNLITNLEEPFLRTMYSNMTFGTGTLIASQTSIFYTLKDGNNSLKYYYFPADNLNMFRVLVRD